VEAHPRTGQFLDSLEKAQNTTDLAPSSAGSLSRRHAGPPSQGGFNEVLGDIRTVSRVPQFLSLDSNED